MELAVRRGLTGNQIKWIAIVCMLIDHIAWAFVPFSSVGGQIMHVFGRTTAPVMCFFLAEGYAHTRSVPRYAFRLGLFAVISQLPFTFFESGQFHFVDWSAGNETFSVIYTLFLSLLAIWAWDTVRSRLLRGVIVAGLCLLALPGDWMFFDIMFALIFWIYRGNFKKQALGFTFAAVLEEILSIFFFGCCGVACLFPAFSARRAFMPAAAGTV